MRTIKRKTNKNFLPRQKKKKQKNKNCCDRFRDAKFLAEPLFLISTFYIYFFTTCFFLPKRQKCSTKKNVINKQRYLLFIFTYLSAFRFSQSHNRAECVDEENDFFTLTCERRRGTFSSEMNISRFARRNRVQRRSECYLKSYVFTNESPSLEDQST